MIRQNIPESKCCQTKSVDRCININTDENCNIVIIDKTYNCQFVQVFIINNPNDKDYQDIIIRDNENVPIVFNNTVDGHYLIYKITIPVDENMPYFCADRKFFSSTFTVENGHINHCIKEVELQELIDVNPKVSKIQIEYFNYFSYCNLRKCFIKICQDILNSKTKPCQQDTDSDLIYKRDLLWAAINVIKYMVEIGRFNEAYRVLQEMISCNGICPQQSSSKRKCGCGR